MAQPHRSETYALILRLMEKPYAYDFFQAVRRIENARATPAPIGSSSRLADDPVRFGQEASLAFATSTIHSYRAGSRGEPDRMVVNFHGLLGPNGPLPLHLTEYIRDRTRNARDLSPARFLDVFHHRMVSSFYRAWALSQPTASFDRAIVNPQSDRVSGYVASLTGLGFESLQNRDALHDLAKLFYAGHFSNQTKHPEGLVRMVADFFGVRCQLVELVGDWIDLPRESQTRLGASPETGSLGSSCVIGTRVWDCQHKFRLRIGPLPLADYERMLPDGRSFSRLEAIVRNYVGIEFAWDVQLVLRKEEVPQTRLGSTGRLGWTTWIGNSPKSADVDDLILRPKV